MRELQELISQLPLANYSLLRALTAHLILIVQNSNVNKMTMRNVGIVFSPTLGIPAGVFSLMLAEFNRVFNVDGEGVDSPVEEEAGAPSPKRLSGISRRNSKQYTDAAADQLLGLTGRSLPGMWHIRSSCYHISSYSCNITILLQRRRNRSLMTAMKSLCMTRAAQRPPKRTRRKQKDKQSNLPLTRPLRSRRHQCTKSNCTPLSPQHNRCPTAVTSPG